MDNFEKLFGIMSGIIIGMLIMIIIPLAWDDVSPNKGYFIVRDIDVKKDCWRLDLNATNGPIHFTYEVKPNQYQLGDTLKLK